MPEHGPRAYSLSSSKQRELGSGRQAPDPIARFLVDAMAALCQPEDPAIVGLVPTYGIQQILTVGRAAVFERLAGDDVVGQLAAELRHERVEGFGELAAS